MEDNSEAPHPREMCEMEAAFEKLEQELLEVFLASVSLPIPGKSKDCYVVSGIIIWQRMNNMQNDKQVNRIIK